jgi:putative transposase
MLRLTRSRGVDSYYHVLLRGKRREALFSSADDRRALNEIAIDVLQRFDARLHAYCLMPTQFRFLVCIHDRLLTKALRTIATRYSMSRQRSMQAASHLFERPYKAERVDTDGDFLQLLRSIHLMPVVANEVVSPADYLWSSHRAYLGYKSVATIDTEFGLSLLSADSMQARIAYPHFIAGTTEEESNAATNIETSVPTYTELLASRNPLAVARKSALARVGRDRSRSMSRRYLSIY